MSTYYLTNGKALPFSTCFWAIQKRWLPLRCVRSDESSSDSEQEFPKIAHLLTVRLKKRAEPGVDSGQRSCSLPGDLEGWLYISGAHFMIR